MDRFSPDILDGFPSLGPMFRHSVDLHAGSVACVDMDGETQKGSWTYKELGEDARRFARLIREAGLKPGDRLSIALTNQVRYLVSAIGGSWSGCVICPLDYELPVVDQLNELRIIQPKALVISWKFWQALESKDTTIFAQTLVIVTEVPQSATLARAQRWQLPPLPQSFEIAERSRDEVANIVFTSGTGGLRKACILTHDNYLQELKAIFLAHSFPENGRMFSLLPIKHGGEFVSGFLAPVARGAMIIHQFRFDEKSMLATMRTHRPTNIVLFPPLIEMIKAAIERQIGALSGLRRMAFESLVRLNLFLTREKPSHVISGSLLRSVHREFGGSLREIFCGGLFINPKTVEFFYRLGIPVVVGYGLTETCMAVTANTRKPFRGDNVGSPYPGLTLEIRNPTPDGIGEVWVRGGSIAKGYMDNAELTKQNFVDGWFHTGDLGRVNSDGALELFGREGHAVTLTQTGDRIYPEYWEAVLGDLPEQAELAIFPLNLILPTRPETGEMLVVANLEDKDSERFVRALRERSKKMTAPGRISHYVVMRGEFPRTTSAKIKRGKLAEMIRVEPQRFPISQC